MFAATHSRPLASRVALRACAQAVPLCAAHITLLPFAALAAEPAYTPNPPMTTPTVALVPLFGAMLATAPPDRPATGVTLRA